MDFSSIPRALESLHRRQPVLSDTVLTSADHIGKGQNVLSNLIILLKSDSNHDDGENERWEPLAVGLYVATEVLQQQQQKQQSLSTETDSSAVYMDGPRVPTMDADGVAVKKELDETTKFQLENNEQYDELCQTLHVTCLQHLEHKEPRIRTLVAKAVGAYCSRSSSSSSMAVTEMHQTLLTSIQKHIAEGRDDEHGKYSRASTGAIDDTTGWRALETNWLCLAAMIHAMDKEYAAKFVHAFPLWSDCEFSCVTHVNRHVRAAAMQTLEQIVRSVTMAAAAAAASKEKDKENIYLQCLTGTSSDLRTTVVAVLKAGLADNWSQVRMAASVLCRVWFTSLQQLHIDFDGQTAMMNALLPRMCLNRFYLAQGVKLYSHETWKMLFDKTTGESSGLPLVATHMGAVVRYYVKMCDADNHVVREGACQAIAELAVRLGAEEEYHDRLESFVDTLLQALLMCFHDESWPVRDEACLACGILCRAFPDACQPEFKTLWERWTEQLTDQIWSVREDAAVALGDALEAYGEPVLDKLRALIKKILPSARDQPAMTAAEYKAHVNDLEQHSNAQLYSCGSLAPKLRKGGAGRIGCTNCGIDRPKAPWEATDGCIYLIRELVVRGTADPNDNSSSSKAPPMDDSELIPLLRELADVCRVQHFPQSDELRSTLWKNVPAMAHALGKQRFKSKYFDIFIELLFSNLESRTASQLSKHAAGQCAEELSKLVGVAIFRGRLEDYQRECFDHVMRERAMMPKGPSGGDVFSPFGPPGLLDAVQP